MELRNNLKNTKTYLVGAMDRVIDGGVSWRKRITPSIEQLGVKIINPCEKPIYGVKEDDETRWWIDYYKETGQYDKIKNKFSNIRNADLRCVDISDFIIAHIDLNVHACGTYEEIVTANRQKKPVLIWCEQGKQYAPNWLFFMLPHEHIFSSHEELIEYLSHINTHEDVKTLSRWFFFSEK
jgi:hypothetical protein